MTCPPPRAPRLPRCSYCQGLSKEAVYGAARQLIDTLGKAIARGQTVILDLGVGKLTARGRAVEFTFYSSVAGSSCGYSSRGSSIASSRPATGFSAGSSRHGGAGSSRSLASGLQRQAIQHAAASAAAHSFGKALRSAQGDDETASQLSWGQASGAGAGAGADDAMSVLSAPMSVISWRSKSTTASTSRWGSVGRATAGGAAGAGQAAGPAASTSYAPSVASGRSTSSRQGPAAASKAASVRSQRTAASGATGSRLGKQSSHKGAASSKADDICSTCGTELTMSEAATTSAPAAAAGTASSPRSPRFQYSPRQEASPTKSCPFANDVNDNLPIAQKKAGIRVGINPFSLPLAPGKAYKAYKISPYAVESSSRGSTRHVDRKAVAPELDPRAGSLAMLGFGLVNNKPARLATWLQRCCLAWISCVQCLLLLMQVPLEADRHHV